MYDKKKNSINLTRAYQEASLTLLKSIDKSGAVTNADLKLHIRKTLNEVVIGLETVSRESIKSSAQRGGLQGREDANKALKRVFNGRAYTRRDLQAEGLSPKNEAAAKAILAAQTARYSTAAVTRAAFLELHSTLRQVKKQVTDDVEATLRELAKTGENTVAKAGEVIKSKFEQEGIFKVTYSNGAKVDCADYAAMVARSARTESANAVSTNQALRLGTDLVQCMGNNITCPVCAQYRNRVFSVTGSDKRFPPLRDGANSPLKGGYNQIHPNCRCEFLPYFEEFRSPEELQKDTAFSNRPFRDDRTMRQKEAYQSWQAKNRQLREELNEYEAMRATLGKDMPYTTLAGFRRAKRAGNKEYWKTRKQYRNEASVMQAYNKLASNEPKITETIKDALSGTNAHLTGLKFRIKTRASFQRKVFAEMKDKDIDMNTALEGINDGVRYTAISEGKTLYDDYCKTLANLQKKGYNIIKVKNTWKSGSAAYRGINTVLEDNTGQTLEMQFHTQESFDCKQKMHALYEEYRETATSAERRAELDRQMATMSKVLKTPDDIDKI